MDKKLKILLWIVSVIIAYFIGNGMDFVLTKPTLDIIMPPSYDEQGIFEIGLINGEKDLKNIRVKVQSCYMSEPYINTWETFFIENLPKQASYIVKFENELTLNKSKLINCPLEPLGKSVEQEAWFNLYKDKKTGKIVIPYQEKASYSCGFCYWNISFSSDKLNKSFYKEMYSPIQIVVSLGNKNLSENSPDLEFFEKIGVGTFDKRSLEIEDYEK